MLRYVLKRLLISIIVLFTVLFLAYTLIYNLPENYAEIAAREMSMMSGSERSAAEWEEILVSEYGLDCGLIKGFFIWLGNAMKGDFGVSWCYGVTVTERFYPAFINSLILGLISSFIALLVAVPLGIYSASNRKKKVGVFMNVATVFVISVLVFFIVALLKYIFAIKLGWFDLGGIESFDSQGMSSCEMVADRISHMVLPVTAMVLSGIGILIRYVHVSIKGLIGARYVKGLKAKGLDDKTIVLKHMMRNAAVPIINIFCIMLPTVLIGSIVIETLFSIDGIGYLAYTSLINGDIPMIMFYILHATVITVGFSFVSDVLCAAFDYRIAERFAGRSRG